MTQKKKRNIAASIMVAGSLKLAGRGILTNSLNQGFRPYAPTLQKN
jgi:hypothetical protein